MTRRRSIIAAVVLLLVVMPLMLLSYVAFTASGLQFVVSHIPRQIGRATIEITAPRGSLVGGFEVDRIEIDHELSHLIFQGIRGRVATLPLLWQTIDGRELAVRDAFVQVRRRTQAAGAYAPRFLPPGLVVRVTDARVDALTLIATNGRRFDTTNLSASAVVRNRTMRFLDTSFDWEAMHVSGSTRLDATVPMRISGDARITIAWPQQPVWTIDASGKGDLGKLGFAGAITTPFRADFTGEARDLTTRWNWSGETKVHDFDLRAWGGGDALGRVTGTLAVQGDSKGFSGRGPLTPTGLEVGAFDSLFEGSYATRVITANRIEFKHPSGAVLEGKGTIAIVQNGPRLDLHGGWRDFRWPLVGEDPPVRSAHGEYRLSGIWPFDWHATGPFLVKGLAPMPVDARGRLAKDRAYLDEVAVEAFTGHANFTGEAIWTPEDLWHVSGRAIGINPAALRSKLPGKLNFDFAAQGAGFDGDGDFNVELRSLAGRLRGVPASGGGKIARRGKSWELDNIRIGLGRTRIEADGHIAREVSVRFAVDAEDLSWITRDSAGRLNASGSVQGTLDDPVIDATIRGIGLRHAGFNIGDLQASIAFDSRNTRASKVNARARRVTYGKRTLNEVSFALSGTAGAHAVQVDAKASDLVMQMRSTGAFAHGSWIEQMHTLNLNGSESLHLELEKPVGLHLSADQMRIEWFCLQGQPARVCADANWKPSQWTTTLNANDLPLRTLTAGLTPAVEYRGSLTVTARAFGTKNEPMQGNLRADLLDARILHQLASGRRQSILLGSGVVVANATPTVIDAQVGLDAGPIGTIDGRIALDRSPPRWQDMPLQGELKMRTAELGYVTLYAPQVDRAAGRLETDLVLSGTAGTPLIDGTIRLSDAELDQYQVNLAMRKANLTARLHGKALDFDGSASVGDGKMTTHGKLEWRDSLPYGKFHLEGERLRVANVPEAHIDASPDLDFELEGQRITVTGKVEVPYAKIEPTDLRNAVRSSSDEVLVGTSQQGARKHFDVITDIDLTLSERVSLETSGLTGRLVGSIRVRSGQDEMTSGTGELSIEEGKYTAYGRKLDIQHGRLIFTGGPVSDPGVDIRAVKQFPEVVAGVNVRGTLLQPRLSFYSEPSLPQSQILSLILAGGSLSAGTEGSVRQTNGGAELLAQGGAILAQQLGQKVGIEDVSVEQSLTNDTSLVLGKYLSPRLYVSYGISLAESINTLKMRYSLNDHWTVRSEVGEARGADLVFTIEK